MGVVNWLVWTNSSALACSLMASTISRTPWPIRFTAAEPAKSRYCLPAESHSRAPSPRTAAGKALLKERRNTEERGWDGAGSDTLKLCGADAGQVKTSRRKAFSPGDVTVKSLSHDVSIRVPAALIHIHLG